MTKEQIYKKALDKYGVESQIRMVFEEMAELQKELCKALRGRIVTKNIAEEIADVEIMIEQLKELYKLHELVKDYKECKLKRLEEMVNAI